MPARGDFQIGADWQPWHVLWRAVAVLDMPSQQVVPGPDGVGDGWLGSVCTACPLVLENSGRAASRSTAGLATFSFRKPGRSKPVVLFNGPALV